MPDRRGATVLDDLPDDIMVGKILILLPPKDIGRCRVVRTVWHSASSTPEFMVEHHRRQPALPIVDGKGRRANFVALRAAGASSLKIWPFLSRCREIRLLASSDGFLIVSRGSRIYICNPTTRKHALLQFPRPRTCSMDKTFIHCLYQNKPIGEYRVLWSRKKEATLYVLTVGSNESRSIQLATPTLPWPSLELIQNLTWLSPVNHRGNLHWSVRGSGHIIVFDTETELFRWMRNPPRDTTTRPWSRLFNMEGTLGFVDRSYSTMDVWVMQDYETETWAIKYRIDESMIKASRALDLTFTEEKFSALFFFNEMGMLNERELLVDFDAEHVLRCDTDCKFLGMVTIGKKQYCMRLTGHRHQESIVPIPPGEMQGEDEEFPFST